GIAHPGADEVIAAYECDWRAVVARATGPPPGGVPIFYQKHMTHHMLPEVELGWLAELDNCFLIRAPEEVLASYIRRRAEVGAEDVGLQRQVDLFEHVRRSSGRLPPVVDARDVLENPEGLLRALCRALGVPFT